MAAIRLFDLFNAKVGATQVTGAETFGADWGYRMLTANNDGAIAQAARDKAAFFASARLGCEEIDSFAAVIALFEANETQSIYAEGKVQGDASKSQKCDFKHAKLLSAGLSLRPGAYAKCNFEFRNAAAAASTAESDEIAISEIAEKTITHSSNLRAIRVKSAVFTPSEGDAITPLAVNGFDLNVRGQVDQDCGDDDFAEVCDVAGYEVTGALTFKDETLAGGLTTSQQLTSAVYGSLAITYLRQAGAADKVLTLSNLYFEAGRNDLAARKYGGNSLNFGCFGQVGATTFTIASGDNKLIGVA